MNDGLEVFDIGLWNLSRGAEEKHEISQDSRCPDQDLNR
jgi:hypothetical protein